ncbi:MAG: His/Gly/Thr/Pro-type tRNA ligase C-terminal domain-containing protein, partial [Limisphaerales bacterium]
QVRVITIGDEEPLINYAKEAVRELQQNEVRVSTDFSTDNIKGKIADAEKSKVHTMLVIGGRDLEAGNISVRLHGKGPQGSKPKAEVIANIVQAIKERRSN